MEWFKKLDTKIKIVIVAAICLVLAVGVFCVARSFSGKQKKHVSEIKYNKNAEILKEREINGLSIHDISLQTEDGQSNYRAKATDKTNEKIKFVGIEFTFYNDAGEMGNIKVYNEREIAPGETIDLVNYNDMDLFSATSVKLELVGE